MILKKYFLIILILFIIMSDLFSNQDKLKIAVMDLQPVGISSSLAITVSDLLRTELFKTKLFSIIERKEMNVILKEQEFKYSGCTETECAVEIGKILTVHKVLVGTINKLGESFIINARIIDIEKGIMEFGESAKVKSESELDTGCKMFAKKISKMIKEEVSEEESQESQGDDESSAWKTIGNISIGAGLLSLGTGVFFNYLAKKNYDESLKLHNEYLNTTTDINTKWNNYKEKHDLSDKQATVRNILYISSGAVITFGIISRFILYKPVKEKISFKIDINSIKLCYKF